MTPNGDVVSEVRSAAEVSIKYMGDAWPALHMHEDIYRIIGQLNAELMNELYGMVRGR